MKVKFWTYPEDMGDGSVVTRIFKSKEEADKYRMYCEDYVGWSEDCVKSFTLEIDNDGNILSGLSEPHWNEEEIDDK